MSSEIAATFGKTTDLLTIMFVVVIILVLVTIHRQMSLKGFAFFISR